MKYKAVIFDMDGLLLDTERIFLDAFRKTCEELGLRFDMSLFVKLIGTNSVKTKDIMTEGFGEEFNYDRFRENWIMNVTGYLAHNSIPLKKGALNLLEKCKQTKLPMAVATSTAYDDACRSLKHAGIDQYFFFVIAGDQVERGKPDPEIYLESAGRLDVDPEECIVFEDSENGVRSACAAGMDVIQVPDLVAPSDEIKALGHRIFGSLDDVCREFEEIFT